MRGVKVPANYTRDINLADSHYKQGDRARAICVLEECRKRLLDCGDLFIINKISNKLEFLNGETLLKSKPLKLEVSLTDSCNLSCLMCLQKTKGRYGLSAGTFQEIKMLMPYLEVINWIGGEACVSPYFEALFDEAARYPRLQQNIITNGLFIDERWAEKIAENKVTVCVSVDGFTAATYEHIRRGAKFEAINGVLGRLKKSFARHPAEDLPWRFIITFVLMKSNHKDLEIAVEFAHSFGANILQVNALLPFDPVDEYIAQTLGSYPEILQWYLHTAMPRILCEGTAKGVKVNLPDFAKLARATAAPSDGKAPEPKVSGESPNSPQLNCPYPWGSFFADSEGRVRPYCLCGGEPAGNVGQQGIMEIWNNEKMRNFRRLAAVNAPALGCERCDMRIYRRYTKLFDQLW